MTVAAVRPVVVDDWAYRPCPQPAGTPQVVCFPHAGGDVTAFARLAAALAPAAEVWAVRLPARGGRFLDPMPAGFRALVAAVRGGIAPHLDPTAVFYGQSLGALLAYEVARALPAALRPARLVVACAVAPDRWPGTVPADDAGASRLLADCGLVVDDAVRELAVQTVRVDLAVARDYRYRPAPRPDLAIHAVSAAGDPTVPASAVARWSAATTGPFSASVEPGGHLLASAVSTGPADLLRSLGGHRVHHHH